MNIFSGNSSDGLLDCNSFNISFHLQSHGPTFNTRSLMFADRGAGPAAAAAATEAVAVLLSAATLAVSLIAASLLHVEISSNSCSSSLIPGTSSLGLCVFQSPGSRCSFGALSG